MKVVLEESAPLHSARIVKGRLERTTLGETSQHQERVARRGYIINARMTTHGID